MDKSEQIYRDLQQHLDSQAVGYPSTRSGAEIRILRRLFNPEEARLAIHLTYKPASLDAIVESAKGSGPNRDMIDAMLDKMVKNGVIGTCRREGRRHFFTIPFVVGMFEGQVKRLTPDLIKDVEEYTSDKAFGLSFLSTELPQLRTIPVGKSISVEHCAAPYDRITEIISNSAGPFAILDCICRKMAAMKGNPCRKTTRRETCMALGDSASMVIENGNGRPINREEALEITGLNEADGLVFQPSNTQKVDFICACCGCCCGILRTHKMLPQPLNFWAASYRAWIKAGDCSGCGICVERCQVSAVTLDRPGGTARVDPNRCIGCGNCAVSCPNAAIAILRKEKVAMPPRDMEEFYDILKANRKGALGKIKIAARLLLKK